jgi:cyclophilin family peptidyl-prolyl cis-trans isomerase
VGTDKRERKKANRQARLEAQRRAARRRSLLRRVILIGGITVGVLLIAFLVSVLADGDDAGTNAAVGGEALPEGAPTAAEAAAPATCPAEDGSSPRTVRFESPPPMCIDPDRTYTAVVTTTAGEFTIALDAQAAPRTVNNFVFLARYHFYDDVAFHRIVPGFVVQGGDAVGDPPGTGGPGYRFEDELPAPGAYQPGSVAMANSGPDTNGSQFFIVTGEAGTALPPLYSLFGTVTEGFDVVLAIEAAGPDPAEPPRVLDVAISQS